MHMKEDDLKRRGLGYRNTRASRGSCSCSIMKREPPAVIETRRGVILHLHLHLQWPFAFAFVQPGSSSTSRKHHSSSIVHRSFSNCNYKIDRRLEARGSRLYSGTCLAVSERTVTVNYVSRTVLDGALAVNHPSITCIRTTTDDYLLYSRTACLLSASRASTPHSSRLWVRDSPGLI